MCLECGHRWSTIEIPRDEVVQKVVSCGECTHFREFEIRGTNIKLGKGRCMRMESNVDLTLDFYCGFGERKEGDTNE